MDEVRVTRQVTLVMEAVVHYPNMPQYDIILPDLKLHNQFMFALVVQDVDMINGACLVIVRTEMNCVTVTPT